MTLPKGALIGDFTDPADGKVTPATPAATIPLAEDAP